MKRALIVVDVQRDFCEGGVLAAAGTVSLLEPLRGFIAAARRAGVKIVLTQDWHPPNHRSFREEGGPWLAHCVAGSRGAELMPGLDSDAEDLIVYKGETVEGAGYSGFEGTRLDERLRELGVREAAVCGVATEHCVRATAIDAVKAGFVVAVLTDLVRPLEFAAERSALGEMAGLGIAGVKSKVWL